MGKKGAHGHSHSDAHTHSHSHSHSHSHGGGGGHGHSHGGEGDGKFCGCCHVSNKTRLACMLVMTFFFFLVELITGHITKSIALITDSFHMLSDSLALVIGFVSVSLSTRKKKSTKNTFGWVRAEVLGALVNSVFLVSLCLGIVVEAVERLIEQREIQEPRLLLLVGFIGLTINVIGLFIFGHAHSHNLPAIPNESDSEDESDESGLDDCLDHQHDSHHHHSHNGDHEPEVKPMMDDPNQAADAEDNDDENINAAVVQVKSKKAKKCVHSHENGNHAHGHSHGKSSKKSASPNSAKSKSSKWKCCQILSDEANMNMRAVFLHVLADALGSVIVIISALINIYRVELHVPDQIIKLIDPLLCLGLVVLILMSTIPLLKESALILLQTVPKEIKINKLKRDIVQKINGIIAVHELHVWKLSGNKIIATAHVTCHNSVEYMQIATELKEFFHKKGIHSTTIQPEFTDLTGPSDDIPNNCILECKQETCNQNTCCGGDIEPSKSTSSPKNVRLDVVTTTGADGSQPQASNSQSVKIDLID